ncbi:GspH/FimT family pseudopilin [Sedimenticola thiotaurini]|uniref:Type II secretion system protein H n=1 Tax=Sedimenticola thiotaurini TaxID=1543721 RepID=A0A0F7JTT0_9GAMM|nr:GspH/FimT family pseudopilin [Sedimenticola thiotaurini]AKH19941.1 hypothetical protein AAY24_05780 [Sedimenticola thiotaurini]
MKTHTNGLSRHCGGLTLLELLTTLAIASITLSLAIPAMGALIGTNTRASSINTMISHLQLGRSEAITRGKDTILCPSQNGQDCLDSTVWEQGYILVEDSNNSNAVDNGDQLIRHVQQPDDRITIRSTPGRKRILFNPRGMSPGYNLTLSFCDQRQAVEPRAIILSNTGRPRLSSTKPDGSAIDCP